MKKIYLSVFTLTMAVATTAQGNLRVNDSKQIMSFAKHDNSITKVKRTNDVQTKGAVLWSDDCSDASNWTFTNTGTLAVDWAVETDVNAIPVSALSPMASATAANGYMFISSDANNTSDNDGTQMVSQFTNATAIDLSSSNYVSLIFSHNYRWWQDARGVRVSGDNGNTWTDFEITNTAGSPDSQNSGNPEITRIDISAVAGGQSQVFVQFYYDDNDFWAWYWAVDDISIVENDPNDVRVDSYFTTDINNDFQYSQIPLAQVRALSMGLDVTNIGINDQDVAIDYDIKMGGTSVDAGTSAAVTITSNLNDSIFHTTTYTPSAVGLYTLDLTANIGVTDDDASNNSYSAIDMLEVTNDVWAHDNGVIERSYSQLFNDDSTAQFSIGNQFLVGADATIWTAEVGLATSTNNYGVGNLMYAQVWSFDGAAWVLQATSEEHLVEASDLGTMVVLGFSSGVDVFAGDQIAVVAGHYGGDITQRVRFAAGGIPSEQQIGFDASGGAWGFIGLNEPPHVRVNFNEDSYNSLSIEENDLNLTVSQNFPNPFNGNTTVNYTLSSNDEVMVEITDVTGKVIEVINEGVRTAGSHTVTINSNKLAAGTYYYSVSTSNGKVTKAMNVTK